MPIGCVSCVPRVVARLMARGPGTVLDLGIGMGFYGAVVRQWLDLGARPWTTRLVGVEGWAEYRNPAWDLYDEVHVQRIEVFLERSRETFDAILLMDVLEHFDHEGGQRIIQQAIKRLAPEGPIPAGRVAVRDIQLARAARWPDDTGRHALRH